MTSFSSSSGLKRYFRFRYMMYQWYSIIQYPFSWNNKIKSKLRKISLKSLDFRAFPVWTGTSVFKIFFNDNRPENLLVTIGDHFGRTRKFACDYWWPICLCLLPPISVVWKLKFEIKLTIMWFQNNFLLCKVRISYTISINRYSRILLCYSKVNKGQLIPRRCCWEEKRATAEIPKMIIIELKSAS